MSTLYPGALDSFPINVDGVSEVIAADVNNPQDAIEALEAQHQTRSLLKIKNASGATVAASDIGYINEEGDFKTTSTVYFVATWAAVIVGGANNSQIIVCTRGRVTLNYVSTAPSIGDFIVTSTTTGKAQRRTTIRPEILAVCLADGAGGTVDVLLLTGTQFTAKSSSNDVLGVTASATSDFKASLDSGGTGGLTTTNVPYDTITDGADTVIKPMSVNELGKMRLWNTTRSSYRLITAVDTGNNNITTVASTDSWANNDLLTIRSQTVSNPSAYKNIEIDLSQQSEVPLLARAILLEILKKDTGGTPELLTVHELSTFANAKQMLIWNWELTRSSPLVVSMPLLDQVFTAAFSASGAATQQSVIRLRGYYVAAP